MSPETSLPGGKSNKEVVNPWVDPKVLTLTIDDDKLKGSHPNWEVMTNLSAEESKISLHNPF